MPEDPIDESQKINTSGGSFIEGEVRTDGGDFIGRDKIVGAIGEGARGIVQIIENYKERELSQIEVAEQAEARESQILADAVAAYVQRLERRSGSSDTISQQHNPYKALLEYDLQDAHLFYGRSTATQQLLSHLERDQLTVLHSESGSGKTSLLKAGIMSQLLARGEVPIYLRPYKTPVHQALKNGLLPQREDLPRLRQAPLIDFLRKVTDLLDGRRVVVIVDQFEEMFTDQEEQARMEFISQLAPCLVDDLLPIRWIFAVRGEWLSQLGTFRPQVRNPFANEMLLRPLSRQEAREVILEPALQSGVSYETELVEQLLDDLGTDQIAPPQLQLVCSALFDALDGTTEVTRKMYTAAGETSGILRGHLEKVLRREFSGQQRQTARRVLEALVTSEKRRALKHRDELAKELAIQGIDQASLDLVLNHLRDSRLLRLVEDSEGEEVQAYELAHDYLLDEIELDPEVQARKAAQELLQQKLPYYTRDGLLLSADELAIIDPHRGRMRTSNEAERLLKESRAAVTRQRRITRGAAIGVVILIVTGLFMGLNFQRNAAEERANIIGAAATDQAKIAETAQAASTEAVAQQKTAEAEANLRQSAEANALDQRDQANRQASIALSRQLAAQAVSLAGGERGDLALLLSIEALRVSPTVDARNGLLTALMRDPRRLFHLHGHMGEIQSLAFSDDGRELLSLGCEGFDVHGLCSFFGVRRRDARSGEPLGQTILSGADFWTVLSAEPRTGALVARDRQANEWDPVTGESLGRPALKGLLSPREDIAVEITDSGLLLRQVDTGQIFGPALSHTDGEIRVVAFNPMVPLMATGGSNGEVRLWNTDDLLQGLFEPQRILEPHPDSVVDLDFSPDGRHLVSAGWDDSVLVWDLESEAPPRRLVERNGISSVTFSPDGRRMVIAFSIGDWGGELQLWDSISWRLLATLAGKAPVAISPDGRLLAAAGADGDVILRDLDQERPLGRSLENAGEPLSLAFLGGGRMLVAGGRDETLRVWDVNDASLKYDAIPTGQGSVMALSAHPDGHRLASGGKDARILLWDLQDRPSEPLLEFTDHEGTVSALDFSPDGERLVSGAFDDTLRLWDVRSGKQVGAPIDVGHDVYAVAFDRSASRVAAATEDGSVLLWELTGGSASGRVVGTHLLQTDGMTGLAFGPEDRFLLSSSLEQTQYWGLVPGEPPVRPPIPGNFAVLHPSGELAALVTDSGEIQLIDISAWRTFDTTLGAHDNIVQAMAFSPDGRILASAAEDDLVLWDVDLASWRSRACAIAQRNLTPEEWEQYLGDLPYEASCPQAPQVPEIPLDAERALGLAVRSATLGKQDKASQLFAEAARLVADSDDAALANEVCWSGDLRGAFAEVLVACEHAVELEPKNARYRDSRGLARALSGDTAGAIEDFEAYVAWAESDEKMAIRVARRKAWIEALEAGRDPFNAMELHWLQGEGLFR